jgi:hypothetical protein
MEGVMGFQKMIKPQFPPRHWSLVGYPGSGKSTFAARMVGPKLVIDADHRFSEVLELNQDDVYSLSDEASHNVDPDAINTILLANMPGSGVKTIIIDSLTAIITPYIVQAMVDREKKRTKNLMASFQKKALAMRQLQDAVTRWGTDTLWIYHLQDSRDANANAVIRSTITDTEIARLSRCINMQLQVIEDNNRRGIQVTWARSGRSDVTLWDESGTWEDMPLRIEEAVYGGLSRDDKERIAQQTPRIFPTIEAALDWGVEQGAFTAQDEAEAAYKHLRTVGAPASATEMAVLWSNEVRKRRTLNTLEQAAS